MISIIYKNWRTFQDIKADRPTPRHNASTSRASWPAFQASKKIPWRPPTRDWLSAPDRPLPDLAPVAGSRFARNLGAQGTLVSRGFPIRRTTHGQGQDQGLRGAGQRQSQGMGRQDHRRQQDRSGRQGRSGEGQGPEYDRRNQRHGARRIKANFDLYPGAPEWGSFFGRHLVTASRAACREPLIA